MNYSIDDADGFAVRIFDSAQVPPIIFQPNNPDNTPFASHAAAEAWAQSCIAGIGGTPLMTGDFALVNGGKVVAIALSTSPIDSASYDKVLPLPDGIIVGATWNATDGFVNP